MKTITFTCETITPMFLSGADGQTPELRPPSIKGALRFWWRAMNGGNYRELKKREDEIFGSTKMKSKLLINVLPPFPQSSTRGESLPSTPIVNTYYRQGRIKTKRDGTTFLMEQYPTNMLDYLTIGLKDTGGIIRSFIKPNEEFKVEFMISEKYFETVLRAFVIMSEFGGLGSKSRNGFGCFRIKELEVDKKELDIPTFNMLENIETERQSFTAFSKDTELLRTITTQTNTWESVLSQLGKIYQKSRETIEEGGIDGWHNYHKRELLSAPIIVGKGSDAQKSFLDRHAKPYFLHVSKKRNTENNQWIIEGKIYCFPYIFLEDNDAYSTDYLEKYNRSINEFNRKLKTI